MAKYISLDEVVAASYTLCDGATDADRVFMRYWAFLGNRELGFSKENVDTQQVSASGLAVAKPETLISTIDMTLFDENDNQLASNYVGYGQRIHDQSVERAGANYISITEDDNFYYFGSDGDDVSYANIRFYAIPIDSTGNPLILERKRFAIMLFVRYMWTLRANRSQAEIQVANVLWAKEAAKQRGENKMPSIQEAAAIARRYMSLVSYPTNYRY